MINQSLTTTVARSANILSGSKTVTTAGVPVVLGTTQEFLSLVIKADKDNTNSILVGPSGSALYELKAGEGIGYSGVNLASIYIDAIVSGEGVYYTGEIARS
jgi:hypothetical protein